MPLYFKYLLLIHCAMWMFNCY